MKILRSPQTGSLTVRHLLPSWALAAALAAAVGGCAAPSTAPPLAETTARLTFAEMAPLPVVVSAVQVVNEYDPLSDSLGGAYYPVPPEEVLRRYAEARLQPVGPSHILKFVIVDASVRQQLENSGHKIGDWLGVGRSEMYEISIVLRLYTESAPGADDGTPPATLTFLRSTHIPADYSIEQREAEQLRFLENFVMDIDKAVTALLQQKMRLAGRFLSPADGVYDAIPDYMLTEGRASATPARVSEARSSAVQPSAATDTGREALALPPSAAPAAEREARHSDEQGHDKQSAAKPHDGESGQDSRLLFVHTVLSAPTTEIDADQP